MNHLVSLALFLTGSAAAAAQVEPSQPAAGFVTGVSARSAAAFSTCLTSVQVVHTRAFADRGCAVVDSVRLASRDGHAAWMLTYRRDLVLDYADFMDTLVVDELVLIRARPAQDRVDVVWHLTSIQTYAFLQAAASTLTREGILVSYRTCANGTGGCVEQFLLGDEQWAVVAEPYLDGLAAAVPAGWSLAKGRELDLTTLTGVQPIARPGDANCCPWGQIAFEVALRAGALHLTAATVGASADADGVAPR
ncbi:MAG: hypothetical protein SF070_00565 [Gemmatimonadota bacterium]|nr:hypothetical protein [Gemmatimonadota bacterium]